MSDEEADLARIQQEIDSTRSDLAETVDVLTGKLDVKGQAKQKGQQVKTAIGDAAGQVKRSAPDPVQKAFVGLDQAAAPVVERARPYQRQVVVGAVVAVLGLIIVGRRRRRTA